MGDHRHKPDSERELSEVLYIGPVRARAFLEAGITNIAALRAANVDMLCQIKGVGRRNAVLIKKWLDEQEPCRPMPQAPEAATLGSSEQVTDPDPLMAIANQTIQDDMVSLDQAIHRLKAAVPARVAHKKLDNQVEKLLIVISELVEGPDTMSPKQLGKSLKIVRQANKLIDKYAARSPLSEKQSAAFASELREYRRRLQGVTDPKR